MKDNDKTCDKSDDNIVTNDSNFFFLNEKYNKIVRDHMLNQVQSNLIFDLFVVVKYTKSIWETLGKKYKVDDARKKKYVTENWLKFQLVDSKPIMEQEHEYGNLVAEGMKMCLILQANVLIKKLSESWSDC